MYVTRWGTSLKTPSEYKSCCYLQGFQYGKDVFQTTTNDRALPKRQQSFGYGNIE